MEDSIVNQAVSNCRRMLRVGLNAPAAHAHELVTNGYRLAQRSQAFVPPVSVAVRLVPPGSHRVPRLPCSQFLYVHVQGCYASDSPSTPSTCFFFVPFLAAIGTSFG